jgi:hypothetical protein
MKLSQAELELFEELRHFGTPLDDTIFRRAKDSSQGLEITHSGSYVENVVHVPETGRVGVMIDLYVENISERIIKVSEIRLKMPWFDPDFHWLKRRPPKELNRWGGYVLSACGPCGFDPSIVINHRLTHDFRLYPGDLISGFLLGEGEAAVPVNFSHRMKVPVELVIFASNRESYNSWMELMIYRDAPKKSGKSSDRRASRVPIFAPEEQQVWEES